MIAEDAIRKEPTLWLQTRRAMATRKASVNFRYLLQLVTNLHDDKIFMRFPFNIVKEKTV